jgi:tripartite ATP-independent transporter DctP family solute receptor
MNEIGTVRNRFAIRQKMSREYIMKRFRILGVALAGASLILGIAGANAASVTMNIGWETPLDSHYGILAKKFQELVEPSSGGSIKVRLRSSGQIGTEDNAFKAMQLGTVDAYFVSQNNISPHFPLMDVFVLPFIFQSAEHVMKVTNGPVGEEIRQLLLKDTGVYLLTFGGADYRDLYNTKRPIEKFEDFAGLKYRVPKNEVMIETFKAFGAVPVPLAWSETPTALETRTIDGGDNGTNVIEEMKFYEFAKYLTIIEHFAGVAPLLASDRFMSKLDSGQKAAVLAAAKQAGEYQADFKAKATEEIRQRLVKTHGMNITYPDKKPFIEAGLKVQDRFAAEKGPKFKELLEKIRAAAK